MKISLMELSVLLAALTAYAAASNRQIAHHARHQSSEVNALLYKITFTAVFMKFMIY